MSRSLLLLVICRLFLDVVHAQSNDMALVKARIRESLSTSLASVATVQGYVNSLQANGTWADIDYTSTAQTAWSPRTHLDRLRAMAQMYAFGAMQGDAALRSNIFLAFDAWVSRDPQSSNWWYQQISTPQYFGEIMLMMEGQISAARFSAGTDLIGRAYVSRSVNSGTNTGANRTDRSYATMMRGLLSGDAALTLEAFLSIGDTIIVNSANTFAEGIQPDQSYEQHGAQLYVAGYGFGYIQGVVKYASWSTGTTFAFSELQKRVMLDYLLDGAQWFVRGNTIEYTSYGRGSSRAGSDAMALGFSPILTNAIAISLGYRQKELETFRDRMTTVANTGAAVSSNALVGNRNFWSSDFLVHHRPAFSISVKTSSTRTLQPETGNGEGLKNLHLGDGVTLIQRTGNEYDNIMPVWDWRRLPGTTIEQGNYSLKPAADWGVAGTSTQAGGVSDGTDGAPVFNYSRLGVSAKKSWFFLGDVMIALGANISASLSTNPVLTTLNQSLLSGSVTYRADSGTNLLSGSNTPSGLRWVNHDCTGYFFPAAVSNATICSLVQTGSWQSINTSQSATPISSGVFSLYFNHGTAFTNSDYAYLVAPGLAVNDMDNFAVSNYVIVRNDGTAQCVKDVAAGKSCANFWAAGAAGELTSSDKCSVLWKRTSDFLDVALSDPTQTNVGNVVLEFAASVAGQIRADSPITVQQFSPTLRLSVALAKSCGRSFQARFFLRTNAFQTMTLSPVADAYVNDGASASTNFGSSTNLVCKLITTATNFTRVSFLRFDLSGITSSPVAASLRLSPISVSIAGIHAVAAVATNSWTESSVTWNNQPNPNSPATAFWLPALGIRTSCDVLPAVLTRTGDTVDLAVSTFAPTTDGYVAYASRENAVATNRPSLDLVFARPEFQIWQMNHFGLAATNPAIAGAAADPDHDGIINAFEFVFGGEPNPANPGWFSGNLLPVFGLDSTNVLFTYRRTQVSASADVYLEQSDDLNTWTRVVSGVNGASIQVQANAEGPGIDRVTVNILRTLKAAQFVRLCVAGLD